MSAVWALADESQRREIEAAHAAAVSETIGHLTETVPTVRRRYGGQVVEEPARDVVAAEYRHTTARGVLEGDVPDPQLHSHVVITSAIREDGRIVAVASRPVFRSARELGAYYRSSLAHQLQQRGYAIEQGTGKHGRYFEIAGVPRGLLDSFSARSREVARAAERFRAQWGRAPERGELRHSSWRTARPRCSSPAPTCSKHGTTPPHASTSPPSSPDSASIAEAGPAVQAPLEDRVEQRLTERTATFEPGEFRAVLLEQSVGELSPREALDLSRAMIAERRVLPLEGGLMTTLAVRAREQAIERRFTALAAAGGRDVWVEARALAGDQIAEQSADASAASRHTPCRSSPAPSAPRSSSDQPAPARASSSTPPPAPSSTAATGRSASPYLAPPRSASAKTAPRSPGTPSRSTRSSPVSETRPARHRPGHHDLLR